MSSIIDYTDRATCVIFGDGAGAVADSSSALQLFDAIGMQSLYAEARAAFGDGLLQREALLHLLLVRTAVQGIIENDGGEEARALSRIGYRQLLAALGIAGDEQFHARGQALRAFMPALREGCEALLACVGAIAVIALASGAPLFAGVIAGIVGGYQAFCDRLTALGGRRGRPAARRGEGYERQGPAHRNGRVRRGKTGGDGRRPARVWRRRFP